MTKNLESAKAPAVEAAAESGRFDQISIALHWLTVLLIVAQFTTAWLREAIDHETSLAAAILTIHRSSGVLTWVVGLVRLVWRRNFAQLPPFPDSMPKLQQTIAKANEYGLYVLLFVQPITGAGRVLFRGHPFELFFWIAISFCCGIWTRPAQQRQPQRGEPFGRVRQGRRRSGEDR